MKILIAPDKFKDTLTASEAASAIFEGVKKNNPNNTAFIFPMADGGEGTAQILSMGENCSEISLKVHNPLHQNIISRYYYSAQSKTAYIDLSAASGLQLLEQQERNPMNTSTYGTGQMIKNAIEKGARKIIVAAGGSATNDFALGAASALGYTFFDKNNKEIFPFGRNLYLIDKIREPENDVLFKNIEFITAYDVNACLYGKNGAAYLFAKQKGAKKEEIEILDKGLRNIANIIKQKFKVDVSKLKGAGAAGGFAAGARAIFNSSLVSGADLIFENPELLQNLEQADLIITGEGKIDLQSFNGKLLSSIIKHARNKKIIAFCGIKNNIENINELYPNLKIISLFEKPVDIIKAKKESYNLLIKATTKYLSIFLSLIFYICQNINI